jgi:glycerol-3-phosphate dehydrogenase
LVKTSRNAATSALSRDYVITVSAAGLVTIAGGKWTTYRRMGEAVIDAAVRVGGLVSSPSQTEQLRLEHSTTAGDPVVVAVRDEMARTVEDVLSRRTRALLLDARSAMQAAPATAATMATELGRDAAWQAAQVEAFQRLARQYCL